MPEQHQQHIAQPHLADAVEALKIMSDHLTVQRQGSLPIQISRWLERQTAGRVISGRSLASCIDKACCRAQEIHESQGNVLNAQQFRRITGIAGNLRDEIRSRPIPHAAKSEAFKQGLDALADMPPSETIGKNHRGKAWRRTLIEALALEMLIAFDTAPVPVICGLLQTADSDTSERSIYNTLTKERLDSLRAEADSLRQMSSHAEMEGHKLLAAISASSNTVKEPSQTDAEKYAALLSIAGSMGDAQQRYELSFGIISVMEAYDIYLPNTTDSN